MKVEEKKTEEVCPDCGKMGVRSDIKRTYAVFENNPGGDLDTEVDTETRFYCKHCGLVY